MSRDKRMMIVRSFKMTFLTVCQRSFTLVYVACFMITERCWPCFNTILSAYSKIFAPNHIFLSEIAMDLKMVCIP